MRNDQNVRQWQKWMQRTSNNMPFYTLFCFILKSISLCIVKTFMPDKKIQIAAKWIFYYRHARLRLYKFHFLFGLVHCWWVHETRHDLRQRHQSCVKIGSICKKKNGIALLNDYKRFFSFSFFWRHIAGTTQKDGKPSH